jgi:F-type H+-transporting ATPase subunit delta
MAELATVARPYAEAVFKTALETNTLERVGDGLAFMAAMANDDAMRSTLMNPKVTAAQKKELFAAITGDKVDRALTNLFALLVDNRREVLVGSIAEQFDELKREHEKVLRARITSAQPLSDAQRADIVAALETRYGKRIEADVDVDPDLLGGARVQIGDQVVHASVRDALAQLAASLAR